MRLNDLLQKATAMKNTVANFNPFKKEEPQSNFGEPNEAQILLRNTLDQTAYTPEAARQLSKLRMHTVGSNNASTEDDVFGGFAQGRDLTINRKFMGLDVLRHEGLHGIDDNIYGRSSEDGSIANSLGFNDLLKKQMSALNDSINNRMGASGLYDGSESDVEKFAYTGMYPNVMMKDPAVADYFSKIYQPMSKEVNYSPVYPDPEKMYAYTRGNYTNRDNLF